MRKIFAVIFVLAVFSVSCAAQLLMAPLDGLSTLRDYKAMRASSTDPNIEGNGDARPIAPGQTLTIAELDGPGRIAHIWFTIADNERAYGKMLVLRMYWDGEKNPSVESPINDFFCEGHGMDVTVNSLPIRVTSDGRGRNCYFPMPFGRSARITVTNEGNERCHALYYYIDWQKMKSLPQQSAYFHAQYRQEFPCVKGQDYVILDAVGNGHYVGCNLSVRQHEPGWWGEGDDRFYVDGEKIPSIQGTGSEDYFCDGWGIRKLDGLYYGFPITEGYETLSRHTSYRFHIQDPVPFTKSLKMVIEHKGARLLADGKWNGYMERFDDFSSVAYWYQTEPHKTYPPLPAANDRVYDVKVIEGESLIDGSRASGGAPSRQNMGGWSGGAQLFFTPKQAPADIEVQFPVAKAGKYAVTLNLTNSFDYGTYSISIDGANPKPAVDFYSADVRHAAPIMLGVYDLSSGEHTVKFEVKDKNTLSKGYYFGLDSIELVKITQ